jgi:putative tryptophan/tyrosine transport system substrate-binding protein
MLALTRQKITFDNRLPTLFGQRLAVEAGGLMGCQPNLTDMYKRAAALDRILKGAKPADLPVGFPTRFQFIINLKTAKARPWALRCLLLCLQVPMS